MKIKATFKSKTMQFLTSIHEEFIPAIGSDLKLYFFLSIKNMGELTAPSALNDEKGYVDESKTYCFTPFEKGASRPNLDMRFWEQANSLEEFLKLNGAN